MNIFFNWLKASGTQAILVLLSTVAACIAATAAIYYGKKSLTKTDLAPLEQNTAQLDHVRTGIAKVDQRLKKQEDTEQLRILASRTSILATGNGGTGNAPYPIQLLIRNQLGKILVTHIELRNERETSFGSFPCSHIGDPNGWTFQADVPIKQIVEWFNSGTAVQSINRMRVKLKIWMSINGTEVYREMAVTVSESSGSFILNGNV